MGRDEQKEEREVLESIFPEEITGKHIGRLTLGPVAVLALTHVDISDASYRISIALDVTQQDGDDSEPRKPTCWCSGRPAFHCTALPRTALPRTAVTSTRPFRC